MATLSVENAVITGLEATMNACAGGGDEFVNDGNVIAYIENGSGGDITVTFATPKTVEGLAVADAAVVVTAAEARFVGPFDPAVFNDSAGKVQVTYSGVTSLTMALVRVN